jgi:hypothetical protein
MNTFLGDNPGNIDISSLESTINILGSVVTLGYLAKVAEHGSKGAGAIGNIATGLNIISTAFDSYQAGNDLNWDTGTDLAFTVIGFFGPKGSAVSLGLTYSKKGIMAGARGAAQFSHSYEKFYINRWSQAIFGVDIKK